MYKEWGGEVFRGAFQGKWGRFDTRYVVEATFGQGFCDTFDVNTEYTGSCDHPLSGKRGVFKNVEGLIQLFDVIPDPGVSGASNFLYAGYLILEDDRGHREVTGRSTFISIELQDRRPRSGR